MNPMFYAIHPHRGSNCKTELFMQKLHEGPRRLGTLGGITFFLLIYGGNGVHAGIVVVVAVAETRFDTGENNERDASFAREC